MDERLTEIDKITGAAITAFPVVGLAESRVRRDRHEEDEQNDSACTTVHAPRICNRTQKWKPLA